MMADGGGEEGAQIELAWDPEMKAAFAELRRATGGFPGNPDPTVAEMRENYVVQRKFLNGEPLAIERVSDALMPGSAGRVPVRIFYPSAGGNLPVIVYLHGGGWVVGSVETHDRIMRLLALASGAAVVGIDYALAPEHRFPRALDDTIAVTRHVSGHGAAFGLDPTRIVLAGDSAGANLAVAAALAIARDQPACLKGPAWLKGVVSLYGVLDCDFSTESYRRFADGAAGLSRDNMEWFWRQYVPDGMDRGDPRLSPARAARADLARLPETLVIAAAYDVLADDSRSFVAALAAAGASYELTIYEGVCHGFTQYSRLVAKARQSVDQAGAFCARVLGISA